MYYAVLASVLFRHVDFGDTCNVTYLFAMKARDDFFSS